MATCVPSSFFGDPPWHTFSHALRLQNQPSCIHIIIAVSMMAASHWPRVRISKFSRWGQNKMEKRWRKPRTDAQSNYPAALPPRIHTDGGCASSRWPWRHTLMTEDHVPLIQKAFQPCCPARCSLPGRTESHPPGWAESLKDRMWAVLIYVVPFHSLVICQRLKNAR